MRIWSSLVICSVAVAAPSQSGVSTSTPRLEAIVQVQRDSIGANIVKISMLDPYFKPAVLKERIEAIGTLTGSGVRGLQITANPIDPKAPQERALRATFAVDGLIDSKGGWVKISPIIKGLATAAGQNEIRNLQINFDFEHPTSKDLDSFSSSDLDVARSIVDKSLVYTVLVKRTDPKDIRVPDFADAASVAGPQAERPQVDWMIVVAVGVAIVAVGALVYCLFLLKPTPPKGLRK